MKKQTSWVFASIAALLAASVLSCQTASRLAGPAPTAPVAMQAAPSPTAAEPTPAAPGSPPATEASLKPTATRQAAAPEQASPTPEPTALPATAPAAPDQAFLPLIGSGPGAQLCDQETCVTDGLFLLKRPVGAGGRNTIVYSSRFGEYQASTGSSFHGVYFLNSTGTPVVAAASGSVLVAGDDAQTAYGPRQDLYGKLVILQHQLQGINQPVYTLYGHLSQVSVKAGDAVTAGQKIGEVGMTGNVRGSTLVFEVRLGENAYAAAVNPELWLEPVPDAGGQLQGALAGRILDAKGDYLGVENILLERLGEPGQRAADTLYLKTYAEKRLWGKGPWQENFAAGDLPAGKYQISFMHNNRMQQALVEVQPGKLTQALFNLK